MKQMRNASFTWIGGATWILRVDGMTIACDPVLCPAGTIQDYGYFKTKRLQDPVYNTSDFADVNLWLLTHNHEDHIDKPGLQQIRREATIVAHRGLRSIVKRERFDDLRFLDWGATTSVALNGVEVRVRAVPALHARRRVFSGLVGNGNGYLLEIAAGGAQRSLYVTGDSVYHKSVHKHLGVSGIDLIVANAGAATVGTSFLGALIGRITNNAGDVIAMNRELRPGMLIPVHWGTFAHYSETISPASFAGCDAIRLLNPGDSCPVF